MFLSGAKFFLFLLFLGVGLQRLSSEELGRIVIAGLFPVSDGVPESRIGLAVKPAVDLALGMINSRSDILPNHHLDIVDSDTKCDMAVATKFFFDMVDSNHTMVLVFGDACSTVSGPIAEISKEWNVSLLSYADTDPVLSDRKKYHNFYRTIPSDNDFNPARLALLKQFNWTNVGTIFQGVSKGTARYGHAHNHLVSLLEQANINVVKSVAFVNDPQPAIKELKLNDVRIIIGNFDEKMARHVFCHAYTTGMYGSKYQWIILGGYAPYWWTVPDADIPCTAAELNTTIYGYISTDILSLSSSRKQTESGLSPQKYLRQYLKQTGAFENKYHGYAFDGVWVIAKAVDAILKNETGLIVTPQSRDLVDPLLFRGDSMSAALNDTDFRGVTGHVRFNGGDRVGSILFEQYQGNKMAKIAEYHRIRDKLFYKNAEPIIWTGRGPPIDRKLVRVEYLRVPQGIYYSMCTLSTLGIIMSVFFLAVNISYREHRYIKMSSPNLNNIIIIGCILTYLSIILLGMDGGVIPIKYLGHICTSRAWVLSIGFTLAFGAMFSKTWRVHSIFTDIALHKKVIKDYKLILVVTVLLFIDAALLVTWHIMDPLQTTFKSLTTLVEGDLYIIPVIEYCKSDRMTIWLALIYAYKGLLLVFGCFLAWETRQVSIPALNDSKYIGMSVYNVVIMCVCGAAVSFVISDQPTSSYVIIGFFIIFCTTITLCLVFVPKIIELKRDPTGEERRIRAKLQKPRKQTSREEINEDLHKRNEDLQQENITYRAIIAEKMRVLHNLMEQLGEDTRDLHYYQKSPVHKKVVELRLANTSPSKLSTVTDVDDGSLCSDTSADSQTWTVTNKASTRITLTGNKSLVSMSTDYTLVEPTDDNCKRGSKITKQMSFTTSHREEDITDSHDENSDEQDDGDEEEDGDVFGGVYCGPPTTKRSVKVKDKCMENGRAKPLTEVHPLVHDIPNKTYRSTDSDHCKPVMGNSKIAAVDLGKQPSRFLQPDSKDVTKAALPSDSLKLRRLQFKDDGSCLNVIYKVDQSGNKYKLFKQDKVQDISCDIIEHI